MSKERKGLDNLPPLVLLFHCNSHNLLLEIKYHRDIEQMKDTSQMSHIGFWKINKNLGIQTIHPHYLGLL